MKKMMMLAMSLALLLVFHSTTFADSSRSSGEILKSLDLVKGDENGNLLESQNLKRQDAILLLLRMLGEDEEARKYTGKSSFTDLKEGSYYYNSVAYAQHKNLTKGMSKTSFGVDKFVSEKEMLAFILRTLKYDNVAWADVVEKAEEVGLTDGLLVQANADAMRAKVFDYMLAGLNTNMKGTNKELGAELGLKNYRIERKKSSEGKADKKVEETYTGDFRVAEVNTDSLKTINIVFTDKINPFDVNKLHIKFDKYSHDLYLSEDGKTISAVFNNPLSQRQRIKLTIKDIKSLNGDVIEEYEEKIVMDDDVKPEFLGAEFLDNRTLMLKFSEPVNFSSPSYSSYKAIEVDGKNHMLKTVKNDSETEIFVIFKSPLKFGEHNVVLHHILDFAKNKLDNQDLDLVLDKDIGAPEVTKIDFVSNKKLRVHFNEPVYNKGSFKIAGTKSKAERFYNNRKDIVEVEFEKNIGLGAVVGEYLEYRHQIDANDNKVDDWDSFYFEEEDDITLPELEITDNINNKVVLEFNKSMDKDFGKVELRTKDGKKVLASIVPPFNFEPNTSDSVLKVDFSDEVKNSKSTTFKLVVEDFRDLSFRANKMMKVEDKISSGDFESPDLVYSTGDQGALIREDEDDSDEDTITFTFSEPMNTDDLKKLYNYRCSDSDYGQFSSIDGAYVEGVYDDDKTVVIVVPNARKIKSSATFTVLGIRDKSGKMMKTADKVKIIRNGKFVLISARATKRDELLLTFSKDVAKFDVDAYEVKKDSDDVLFISDYKIDEDDARKVKVFLDEKMSSSPSDYVLRPMGDENEIRGKFDEKMTKITKRGISDDVGPYVEKIESKDLKFIVTMSEPVLFDDSKNSVSKNIMIYDQDDKWLKEGSDYKVKKMKNVTSDYVSEFQIIGLNPDDEYTFSEGLSYKIEILAAWTKSGAQSKIYKETVELRGDED